MMEDEDLAGNAFRTGRLLRDELRKLSPDVIKTVRGKGLLNAIVINDRQYPLCTFRLWAKLMHVRCISLTNFVATWDALR